MQVKGEKSRKQKKKLIHIQVSANGRLEQNLAYYSGYLNPNYSITRQKPFNDAILMITHSIDDTK